MTLLYLILGHLLADFVLQTTALVEWKQRSWKGSAVHAMVHFAVTLLLFLPFLSWRVVLIVGLVAMCHFLIDCKKIIHEKKAKKYMLFFLFDQFFHAVILAIGAVLIGTVNPILGASKLMEIYANPLVITYFNFAIICTFVVEIFQFQRMRVGNMKNKLRFNYRNLLTRLALFSAIYGAVAFLFLYFGGK